MDMQRVDQSIERKAAALLLIAWHHKVVFLVLGAVTLLATMVTAVLMEPVYEGSTLLITSRGNLQQSAEGLLKAPRPLPPLDGEGGGACQRSELAQLGG